MGMRRAATVTATVSATTATITPSTAMSLGIVMLEPEVVSSSIVRMASGQMRSMIEKKISRLAPLPRPRSVICSPSHMTKTPPVLSVSTVVMRKPNPGSATALGRLSVNTAKP